MNCTYFEHPFPFCFYAAFHLTVKFALPFLPYTLKAEKEQILVDYLVHNFSTQARLSVCVLFLIVFCVLCFQRFH